MTETNKATLEKGNASIKAGDHEGFLEHCTEDTLWTFVGDKTLRGKEEVRQWMTDTYVSPPQFKVDHLLADGAFVTAIGEIEMMDEEGKPAVYSYCDVWRFDNGKMAELKAFVIKM